jgi:hypothetical protein
MLGVSVVMARLGVLVRVSEQVESTFKVRQLAIAEVWVSMEAKGAARAVSPPQVTTSPVLCLAHH